MKTIGLVGGISPQSTLKYYEQINHFTNEFLGGHHSAKIIIVSVNFEEIVSAIYSNRWDIVSKIMLKACLSLEACNADIIAFCSNTLYKVVHNVSVYLKTRILHILDPVVSEIKSHGFCRVAMIGTRFTMEESFHKNFLVSRIPNLDVIIPEHSQRDEINKIIFDELCHGKLSDNAINIMSSITKKLIDIYDVDAIILGCTELQHIFSFIKTNAFLLDTTELHARALVKFATEFSYQNEAIMIG